MRSFKETHQLIEADLRRLQVDNLPHSKLLYFWLLYPGFRTIWTFRWCQFLQASPVLKWNLGIIGKILLRRYRFKYGISIPLSAKIGGGFRIEHFGGVFISPGVRIGSNCSIAHEVTFGFQPRGIRAGSPVSIGDNVYIGAGAKLVGRIVVGDDVVIGANSVVARDVLSGCTVLGVPARVVNNDGSVGYIARDSIAASAE